jgi:fructuronate reductase
VLDVLVALQDPEAVLAQMAAPDTGMVTLTITEKGYCLGADGQLDFDHPDIKADIANPGRPSSALGYVVEGLRRRRAAGLKPFALISCDNLVDNGLKLLSSVSGLARAQARDTGAADPDLWRWILEEVSAPRTMVDSITPATDDDLRARVSAALGMQDRWPIRREAFTQWVVERAPRLPDLDWASMGVTLTYDVSFYERAKLRILNASHSALAYLGLLAGHETVLDAVSDSKLAGFISEFVAEDVIPSLRGGFEGFDIPAYAQAVLKRFHNPEIRHLLSQIAWDGSQKLPNRLFGLTEEALAADRPIARQARIVAAWLMFLRAKARDGDKLVDPMAPLLLETAARCSGDPDHDVGLFLDLETVFRRPLGADARFRAALIGAYAELVNQV